MEAFVNDLTSLLSSRLQPPYLACCLYFVKFGFTRAQGHSRERPLHAFMLIGFYFFGEDYLQKQLDSSA